MAYTQLSTSDVTSVYLAKKHRLSFFHVNTQSACNKADSLHDLFLSFNFLFDVVMLTETWYHQTQDIFKMTGYNTYYLNRVTKRGGGVLLMAKKDFCCEVIEDFSVVTDDFEILTVLSGKLVFSVLYRPPGGNISTFLSFVDMFFGWINENRLKLVLGGDVNINMSAPTLAQREFATILTSNAFVNAVTVPTRIQGNSASLIDVFITNIEGPNVESGTIGIHIGDHLPIFLMTDPTETKQLRRIPGPTLQDINAVTLDLFRNELVTINWEDVYAANDPDIAYEAFLTQFISVYKKHFPRKGLRARKSRKPWITTQSLKLIKEKDALYRRFLKTRNPADLLAFKAFRNKVTSCLRQAKRNYLFNLFNAEALKRTDVLWKKLNSVLGREKEFTQSTELILNGKPTYGTQLANEFNNYFVNIVNSDHNPHIVDYMAARKCKSAFLAPTSSAEVCSVFSTLQNIRSCDYDDLQIRPVKYTLDIISPALAHVYNLAFSNGAFPARMKMAKVSVIFKGGDKNDLSNYRPISVLPVFSKGLEKIITGRMTTFCEKHNIINDSQFGFTKGSSTESALLAQKELILKSFENKLLTLAVFVDFSKAFDRINDETLLTKLEYYGFRGVFLDLLRSYLQYRSQVVVIDNKISASKPLKSGVPQGSILGPLLFIIYINDIVNIAHSSKFVIYADDTTLFFTAKEPAQLLRNANDALTTLNAWSTINALKINTTKTKAVLFRPKNAKALIDGTLHIGTSVVNIVPDFKSLGVYFEENMTWNKQVENVAVKLSRSAGVLTRLRFFLPQKIKLLIYNSLFFSHLNYCLLVWGNTTNANISRLYLLQKKAVRAIANSTYDAHTSPLFETMNISPVPRLYNETLTKRYQKERKRCSSSFLQIANLTPHSHSHNTRHAEPWLVPCPRTNYGKQLLCYTLSTLLNSHNQ